MIGTKLEMIEAPCPLEMALFFLELFLSVLFAVMCLIHYTCTVKFTGC